MICIHLNKDLFINKTKTNTTLTRSHVLRQLLVECDLLTRLMDVFEENQNNKYVHLS